MIRAPKPETLTVSLIEPFKEPVERKPETNLVLIIQGPCSLAMESRQGSQISVGIYCCLSGNPS